MKRLGGHGHLLAALFFVAAALMPLGALAARTWRWDWRAEAVRAISARLNAEVSVGRVAALDARGIRLENIAFQMPFGDGGEIRVQVPRATAQPHWLSLVQGKLELASLSIEEAVAEIRPPAGALSIGSTPAQTTPHAIPRSHAPFNILGKRCALRIVGDGPASGLTLEAVEIAMGGGEGQSDFWATLSGRPGREGKISLRARMEATGSYSLNLDASALPATLVRRFSPHLDARDLTGTADVAMEISGVPGEPVHADARIRCVKVDWRDRPVYFPEQEVTLDCSLIYDMKRKALSVPAIRVISNDVALSGEGVVVFTPGAPDVEAVLRLERLPAQRLLDMVLAKTRLPVGLQGAIHASIEPLTASVVNITGPLLHPLVAIRLGQCRISLSCAPSTPGVPKGTLDILLEEASWDSAAKAPSARIQLQGGAIEHVPSALTVSSISGFILLEGTRFQVESFSAKANGGDTRISGFWDINEKTGEATYQATILRIEDTLLHERFPRTVLSGAASVDGRCVYKGGSLDFEGALNGQDVALGYSWWFRKPEGFPLQAAYRGKLAPHERLDLHADVATRDLVGAIDYAMEYGGGRWRMTSAEAAIEQLDITAIGQCFAIPYSISGGKLSRGTYSWRRDGEADAGKIVYWRSTLSCALDTVTLQAAGAPLPMTCEGIQIFGDFFTAPTGNTANLKLDVVTGRMPPIGGVWFVPMDVPPDLALKYPPDQRGYTYSLACADLTAGTWKGKDFTGDAYFSPKLTGFKHFAAELDGGGTIQGAFDRDRTTNYYTLDAAWEGIPAIYLINHMKWPEILTGTTTGGVRYEKDTDDPRSLKGSGRFEVREGKFSSDYTLYELGQALEDSRGAIPSFLQFDLLAGQDISFEDDLVQTPGLNLRSPGVRVDASGSFRTGGDMDYDVKLALSPERAAAIQILRDYLNLEGHRLAQQDVNLQFKVQGPTFRPRGELSQPPSVSVTLVAGGLELVSDAMKIIDIPRKILLDLFKMGGGVLSGAANQPGAEAPPGQ